MAAPHKRACIALAAMALLGTFVGCATVPSGRYAVNAVDFTGVEEMDEETLAACLATRERTYFTINFGQTSDPACGVPPFDDFRLTWNALRWPWTEYPLFDRPVWERDLERVTRWYRARGFYQARVTSSQVEPIQALERRQRGEALPCEPDCEVQLEITVEEGEPVLVTEVHVSGLDVLPRDDQLETVSELGLHDGDRFDEALYDQAKVFLADRLANLSYAHAVVEGHVELNPEERTAGVHFHIDLGPPCSFGEIRVEQNESLDASIIADATLIDVGDPFSRSAVTGAQRAIYALGTFSSVEVAPQVPEDRTQTVVPLVIRAVPGRLFRVGFGAGIQGGTVNQETESALSVPEWDVHLLALLEFRNFFGGFRRLQIEERPRLIFQAAFPRAEAAPQPGNELRLVFRQPSFIEPRTTLAIRASWDLGPDPFEGYFRHNIGAQIGPERYFFDNKLFLAVRFRGNFLEPIDVGPTVPESDFVLFFEEFARLDLRDDSTNTTSGFFAQLGFHQAGYFLPSSWDYLRLTPEVRGYVPLPFLNWVLAGRFALGMLLDLTANDPEEPDSASARLGPSRYRLRGGGASSVRGYQPGFLGDSEDGGLRRWEASLELRMPITENFGVTLFGDAGDVDAGDADAMPIRNPAFRFERLHLTLGIGLRYRTIVGPLRLDVGWAVPGFQELDQPRAEETQAAENLFGFPGAIHLTIGEAF